MPAHWFIANKFSNADLTLETTAGSRRYIVYEFANQSIADQTAGIFPQIRVRSSVDGGAIRTLWTFSHLLANDFSGLQVRSIGKVGVSLGREIRGQATFAGAATKTVSFIEGEGDANYYIALSKNVNEDIWVTGKASNEFILNSS